MALPILKHFDKKVATIGFPAPAVWDTEIITLQSLYSIAADFREGGGAGAGLLSSNQINHFQSDASLMNCDS